jgi:hypothetical protein
MAVLGHNIAAMPEEMAGKRALAFMDVNTFKNLYYSLHTEAADRFVDQARSPDDPAKLSQEELSTPLSKAGEEQTNIMDQFSTPGELMIVYGPLHSPEVEKIFEQYANQILASYNDPTINSAATERLSERIFSYQDSIFDEFPDGMSEEEKKQKEHLEAMSNLMENFAQMEEEQMRLEKWNEATHNFGGMKMSGEDLQKVFDFLKDPANRAKIEEKMKQDGVSEETIKKGREEMDEYIRLKELQKKSDLTKAEQDRLRQIEQSEEFKKYAQNTAEFMKNRGIDLPSLKTKSAQKLSQDSTGGYKSREFQIYAEQAAKTAVTQVELDASFNDDQPFPVSENKKTEPVLEQQANSLDTSMKASWNVVDMKQAFQDNNMTTDATVPEPVASNIKLIQENKIELLEPSNKQQEQPTQIAATAPSAAAGFNL